MRVRENRAEIEPRAISLLASHCSGSSRPARICTAGDGEAADQAWVAAMRVADYLIWSVAPKQSTEIVRLAMVLPTLNRGLKDGLAKLEIPEAERNAFLDGLLRARTLEMGTAKMRALSFTPWRSALAQADGDAVAVPMQPDGTVRFEPRTDEAEGVPTVSAAAVAPSVSSRAQSL
jgi:hypothetical protein